MEYYTVSMSNIRRLTPAPPPSTNAWDLNTLVLPKQEEQKVVVKATPICKQDIDINESLIPSLQFLSTTLVQPSATFPSNASVLGVESPHPKVVARITNKPNNIVNVGKKVKIRKPAFPRSKDIKGGNGLFKYKITDEYNKPVIMSQPNLWTAAAATTAATATAAVTTSLYTLRPDIGFLANSAEDHSTISVDSAIPSPILIPSSNTSFFPQSPRTFSPQQPMVVYGMPMYLHLPLQHLPPQLVMPASPENKRDTLKGSIKKQLHYYFSTENLCKDTYLRSLFDKSDGKLRVKSLIEFNRLKKLTHDGKYVELVIEAGKELPFLEVLDGNEFIRLKTWEKWVMP